MSTRTWRSGVLRRDRLILLGLALATTAAQAAGPYDLGWSTIDNGGGTSTGGVFSLSGTIGQADAASVGTASSAGVYTLSPGYWPGVQNGAAATDTVFKDGFE